MGRSGFGGGGKMKKMSMVANAIEEFDDDAYGAMAEPMLSMAPVECQVRTSSVSTMFRQNHCTFISLMSNCYRLHVIYSLLQHPCTRVINLPSNLPS
jgi:hypothetical protein